MTPAEAYEGWCALPITERYRFLQTCRDLDVIEPEAAFALLNPVPPKAHDMSK